MSGLNCDTTYTHGKDYSLSWLGTGTSIRCVGVKMWYYSHSCKRLQPLLTWYTGTSIRSVGVKLCYVSKPSFLMKWSIRFTRLTSLVWFILCYLTKTTVRGKTLHTDIFLFRVNQCLFLLFNVLCSAANTKFYSWLFDPIMTGNHSLPQSRRKN